MFVDGIAPGLEGTRVVRSAVSGVEKRSKCFRGNTGPLMGRSMRVLKAIFAVGMSCLGTGVSNLTYDPWV